MTRGEHSCPGLTPHAEKGLPWTADHLSPAAGRRPARHWPRRGESTVPVLFLDESCIRHKRVRVKVLTALCTLSSHREHAPAPARFSFDGRACRVRIAGPVAGHECPGP